MSKAGTRMFLLLSLICAWAGQGHAAGKLEVFAGIPPVGYFVQQIGGDYVHVQTMLQPGGNPHTFEPTPRQMMALTGAKFLFKVGMPFEDSLAAKVAESFPALTVVDTTSGLTKRQIVDRDEPGASSSEPDPHVWLSPPLIKIQVRNIADALTAADPAHAGEYKSNLDKFLERVDVVHAKLVGVLAPYRGHAFYVFHPAFGYFADTYGLKQEAVEVEGKSPTPKDLAGLIKKAKADGVRMIFVQPQFASESAKTVAGAIGGRVVPMDDLAPDVLKNLEDIAAKIDSALQK